MNARRGSSWRGGPWLFLLLLLPRPIAAQEARTLRVLTYNIHHGEGTDGRFDLERLAAVIRSVDPDLVALQEVDDGTGRSSGIDQAAELARLTGMTAHYARAMAYDGGGYGEAVLARLPIVDVRVLPLPAETGKEPRAASYIRVRLPSGGTVGFAGTHLDHTRDPASRIMQAERLVAFFDGDPGPLILAGDLNAPAESEEIGILLRHWQDSAAGTPAPTFPSSRPDRRIDYVLFRGGGRLEVIECRVITEETASDHRPLLVVFRALPAREDPLKTP